MSPAANHSLAQNTGLGLLTRSQKAKPVSLFVALMWGEGRKALGDQGGEGGRGAIQEPQVISKSRRHAGPQRLGSAFRGCRKGTVEGRGPGPSHSFQSSLKQRRWPCGQVQRHSEYMARGGWGEHCGWGSSFPAPFTVSRFLGWRGDGHAPTPSALLLQLEGTLKGLAASQRERTIWPVKERKVVGGSRGPSEGRGPLTVAWSSGGGVQGTRPCSLGNRSQGLPQNELPQSRK